MCFPARRNPACMDMCSKCYREQMSEQERAAANGKTAAAALNASRMDIAKAAAPVLPLPAALPESAPEPAKAEAQVGVPAVKATEPSVAASSAADEAKRVQKNLGRCFECSKKIGLASRFQCRCQLFFCSTHRWEALPDPPNACVILDPATLHTGMVMFWDLFVPHAMLL